MHPERSTTRGGSRERIGVFGGTFDPPHIGHLSAALEVREKLALDRVLLTVANRPWQKVGTRPITAAAVRLAMVRAAVDGLEGLEASDLEIRRGGDSYTVDTLGDVAAANPGADLFLILGTDAAALIPTWDRAEQVATVATIVAYDRVGASASSDVSLPGVVQRLEVPRLEVSSTQLRARVAAGRRIDVLCPRSVIEIVEAHGLYRDGNP